MVYPLKTAMFHHVHSFSMAMFRIPSKYLDPIHIIISYPTIYIYIYIEREREASALSAHKSRKKMLCFEHFLTCVSKPVSNMYCCLWEMQC